MINEKTGIDQLMRREIEKLGVPYDEEKSRNKDIDRALSTASKSLTKKVGKPEFIFFSNNYLIIIEDKKDINKLSYKEDGEVILDDPKVLRDYAVNGAIHYARHIINNVSYINEVFAVGASGNEIGNIIELYHVTDKNEQFITELKSLEDLAPDRIQELYDVSILGKLPKEERELIELKRFSELLHEDLRNYGSLEGERKASVVSCILLALENSSEVFKPENLHSTEIEGARDGEIIFNATEIYLTTYSELRPAKIGQLLESFLFIKNDVTLNRKRPDINMSPLKLFTLKLSEHFKENIKNSDMDVLGNFYGEFVKYGGSDGNSLGIVLTPRHITRLMCDLINVSKDDYVLDPCAGSGGMFVQSMKFIDRHKGMKDTVEIGYVFNPQYAGKGYAYESVNAVIEYLFENQKVHRIQANMDARNLASSKLCEKLGMRKEAHFIKDFWNKGEWTDSFVYGMLIEDYQLKVQV